MQSSDFCDECVPSFLSRRELKAVSFSTILISSLPLVLTWVATVSFAHQKLFPILSSDAGHQNGGQEGLPTYNKSSGKEVTSHKWKSKISRPSSKRLASAVFSTSIGLSTVLVELLLCEVSNVLNPTARARALQMTLGTLLLLVIVVTPALEIHGITKTLFGNSAEATSTRRRKPRLRIAFELMLLVSWLAVFWYLPQASPLRKRLEKSQKGHDDMGDHFSEGCLERVGIIGISLMASLSGFAAVSSLWQTFGIRQRVKESTISRRANGLHVTEEMLSAKKSRVRALQHRLNDAPAAGQTGILGRVMGAFQGSNEATELRALQMEVSGLEMMRFSLSSSLSQMRSRFADQERSKTRTGKLINLFNMAFAVYCAYRIVATCVSSLRRWWQPTHSFATSDPINNVLALLTAHWDSELDRAAWSRLFSFLLSGVMLLASFSAVLQTFRLFARFAPSLVQHAQLSLPLIISQIAGTYVIASAILLGSNLPADMSSVVAEALGAPLEGQFVEGWFESWFLVAVGLTGAGIFVGRRLGVHGSNDDWDDDTDAGARDGGFGKRS